MPDPEPAWLLRRQPLSESGLWLDFLTRSRGRMRLAFSINARNAPLYRAILQPGAQLELHWRLSRTGKLRLTQLDPLQPAPDLSARTLACLGYLHELLLYLLAESEPATELFDAYRGWLPRLVAEDWSALRQAEWLLLSHLGQMPDWAVDASGQGLLLDACYTWQPQAGWRRAQRGLSGQQIAQIGRAEFHSPELNRLSRVLFQQLLTPLLAGQPLHSRKLWQQLQSHTGAG